MSPAGTLDDEHPLASDSDSAQAPDGLPYDWPNRSVSRRVDADGIRWHVQRAGSGEKLLLIHGTAASTHTWRHLLPELAKHYEVVAMDLPGHGYTTRRPDGVMTLDALATSLCEMLDVLDFQPDYVAGHSAGAAIALRMSINGCLSPRAIVGLNAALLPFGGAFKAVFSPMAQLFATTRLMPKLVARRARDPKAVRRVLVGTGSIIDDDGVEFYRRLLQREAHVSAVLSMMASWDLKPLLADIPLLKARLYLLAGGRDKAVSPCEANTIAKRLPATRVTRLDDCGHLAHEEAPARVAALICEACRPQQGESVDV